MERKLQRSLLIIVALFLNSCSFFEGGHAHFLSQPPLVVSDNGSPISLKETNTITWAPVALDEASVVHHYEVSLGTSPGVADVAGWVNVNLDRSYKFTRTLDPQMIYYANVRYVEKVTLTASSAFSSAGFSTPINVAEKIVAGEDHTCAISRQGKVKCWGSASSGRLGYENSLDQGDSAGEMAALAHVNLGSGRAAKEITLSDYTTCVILDNDQVKCWGYNSYGQLGYDDTTSRGATPGDMTALGYVNLGTGRTAKSISSGSYHMCAILDNNQVKCWGYNQYGQLGYDDTAHRGDNPGEMAALAYVNLGSGRTAKSISVGSYHTCAILDNDQLKCWGYNWNGQLGYDNTTQLGDSPGEMAALAYVNLGSGRTAKTISSGGSHTCAILDNDQVKCWGSNWQGPLGYDNTTHLGDAPGEMAALAYVNLGSGRTAKSISSGDEHTCAVLDNDQVKCWGDNQDGQLGYSDIRDRGDNSGEMAALGYVNLGDGRTAKSISATDEHTCALLDNDQFKCWGDNSDGKLGYDNEVDLGNNFTSMLEINFINLGTGRIAKSVTTGNYGTCSILDNDQVKCWGWNTYGQLGYDGTLHLGDSAGEMAALGYVNLGAGRTAKMISKGYANVCAILDNDEVKCWGNNWQGQLGYDDTAHRGDSPGEMAALGYVNLGAGRTAKYISVGSGHTCAILDNDELKCWGYNNTGELGYDDTAYRGDNPGEMAALGYVNLGLGRTAKYISVGSGHTCAILDNDQLKCWGNNSYGQLGYDDTTTRGNLPGGMAALGYVNLGPGRTAKSVVASSGYTCAILDNDQLKCWGSNWDGQLGYDNTTHLGDNPGEMAALGYVNLGVGRTAKMVSSDYDSVCALLDNDQIKCWGDNDDGQLGYDDITYRGNNSGEMAALNYVNLGTGRTAKSVSVGSYHACAILDNNQMKCWGNNQNGQLGQDNTTYYGKARGMADPLLFLYTP